MWTKTFWARAAERAVRAAATAAVTALGTTAAIQAVDWRVVGGAAALAAVASVLGSLIASGAGDPESTTFVE